MPVQFEISGNALELDEREVRTLLTRISAETRNRVFLRPKIRFEYAHSRWQYYANSNGALRWVVEAEGNARLPQQGQMRRLSVGKRHLESYLNPRKIHLFYQSFPDWLQGSRRFNNQMSEYVNRFETGGQRTIRDLRIVRNTSFSILKDLAMLAVAAPAALAVRAGTISAGRALAGTTALNIAMRQAQSAAQDLSRRLSGNPPTRSDSEQQIVQNTLDGLNDAAFGTLVGQFMQPITGHLHSLAARAIAGGRLGQGIAMEQVAGKLDGILTDALDQMTRGARRDLQRILLEAFGQSSEDAVARRTAQQLMENRRFRALVEQGLAA